MSDWKNVQYKDGKLRTNNGGSGGASALSDLTDVDLTNIADGQILKWDATNSKWVNANESGGGSGHTYSTTEQVVGTWIDGKNIYEITYNFSSAISVSYNSYTETTIDSSNIDNIISCIGIHDDGTNFGTLIADPTRSSHTKLGLQTGRNGGVATCKKLILQYTKITD